MEVARRLGYRSNRTAQALRRKKVKTIGLLNFGIMQEIIAMRLERVLEAVRPTGYFPLISHAQWDADGYQGSCDLMIHSKVAGVVLINAHFVDKEEFPELQSLLERQIPVVAIGGNQLAGIPRFLPDKEDGFYHLTHHLLRQGRRRIHLQLKGYPDPERTIRNWHSGSAIRGYRRALREVGAQDFEDILFVTEEEAKEVCTFDSPFNKDPYAYGYLGTRRLLGRDRPFPDAIMASNDSWAFGAMAALAEAGVRVPEDVALTGFEDELASRYGPVPLTTYRHPLRELARAGVDHLMALIETDRPGPESLEVIRGELVVRRSCGSSAPFSLLTTETSRTNNSI